MDSETDLNQIYRLMALCARAEGHPAFETQLEIQLRGFNAWELLPAQAELHGMGPLLWHHLHKKSQFVPIETQRSLGGLYLRNRLLLKA